MDNRSTKHLLVAVVVAALASMPAIVSLDAAASEERCEYPVMGPDSP